MKIEERYDKVNRIYYKNEKMILEDIKNSNYPKSFQAIYYKIKSIESILSGLEACKTNFYSSQILARTLFEHYLVAHYVYLRWNKEKSDEVGVDFYRFYYCSEFFKRETYSKQVENIKKDIPEKITIDTIVEKYPDFGFMSQKDLQEIHSKSRQFTDIKKIGEYLIKYDHSKKNLTKVHHYMLEFLNRYNILSSFIHGGPKAEQDTFYRHPEWKGNGVSSPAENIEWGQIASNSCKNFLVLSLMQNLPDKYSKISKQMIY